MIERYRRRLSGPLRDRFDLAVEMPAVPWSDLRSGSAAESSATVRARVMAARARQMARQGCLNGRLAGRALDDACALRDHAAEALLGRSMARLELSARAVVRVLRAARTIADLGGGEAIEAAHVAEALQFRLPSEMARA